MIMYFELPGAIIHNGQNEKGRGHRRGVVSAPYTVTLASLYTLPLFGPSQHLEEKETRRQQYEMPFFLNLQYYKGT